MTMVRRPPLRQRNANAPRNADRPALARLALLLGCGSLLAGGFLYAGGLHFAALRNGYQTETLRREREHLIAEQRRFLLEREAAASPARLEQAARQLGMQPLQPQQIDPLSVTRNSSTKTEDKKALVINHPPQPADKGRIPAPKKERLRTGMPR
jgi:cell division protein FtsL